MVEAGAGNVARSSAQSTTILRREKRPQAPKNSITANVVWESPGSRKKSFALVGIIVIAKNGGPNKESMAIRDLGYLSWKNDLGWMEAQKGPQWNRTVQAENKRFVNALRPLQDKIKAFEHELNMESTNETSTEDTVGPWTVEKDEYSPVETWHYKDSTFAVAAWAADTNEQFFAAAIPNKHGFERFTLEVYRLVGSHRPEAVNVSHRPEAVNVSHRPQRIHQISRVGPYVAFSGSDIVYLGSKEDHRYSSVHRLDPETGRQQKLFEIKDPKENLHLKKLEDDSVCVVIGDFVSERLGFIHKTGIRWAANANPGSILPIDKSHWIVNGRAPESMKFLPAAYIESVSLSAGWAISLSYGIRTLWKIAKHHSPVAMVYIWGEVSYDTRDPTTLSVCDMRYEPYRIQTKRWTLTKTKPQPFICSYYNGVAPIFVISGSSENSTKGLLITAYGAYGFPTKVGRLVQRWRPLLNAGWSIASVGVPGSGDHDLAWRQSGQRENRKVAVKTLCAAIKDLQEELNVQPSKTALYGRSAGGLLVSAVIAQDPGLVGALYIESPYLDALRTLTNPAFPLTVLESNEFGIGSNPVDVIALGSWSPMERIPTGGYPGLFVLARTDMADLEVYPYEPLKYITRVRGYSNSAEEKLLYISSDQGHFTTTQRTRAEDLALLDSWVSRNKNRSSKYKMPYKNKNKTKKNKNKNRKNKNKNKSRRNKQ